VKDLGVGGLVRTGAWCDAVLGREVLSIGRSAIDKEDCVLELCGSQLLVRVAIASSWIWISACSLDEDTPEFLFNIGDAPAGWLTVRRFCQALERSGVRSLHPRPIQLGEPGAADCFVIA
jgi:hypothetical protein